MAAQEGLPGPQRIALARRVVIGVGDDDLPAVAGGRVVEPAGRRTAGRHRMPTPGEDLVVVAGRDPVGGAVEQRVVDLGLVRDGELHRHPDGVRVVAHLLLVPLDDVDDPVLPLGSSRPTRARRPAPASRQTACRRPRRPTIRWQPPRARWAGRGRYRRPCGCTPPGSPGRAGRAAAPGNRRSR